MKTRVHSTETRTLHWHAPLSLAGAKCGLLTNSPALLSTLDDWRCNLADDPACDFTMNVLVDGSSYAAHGRPFFRGLHHIVIAKFDDSNVFVFDVLRRTVNAVVTKAVALDTKFWEGTLLPLVVGVLGAAIRVLPVHCACLSSDGKGLLIAGVSGSGKSTLSVALAQEGLTFLSDDWTYISILGQRLIAHGMSAPIKLLPDAVEHFPSLVSQQLKRSLNGEFAYEVHPEEVMGLTVERVCEPRSLIFPERGDLLESELIPVPPSHMEAYIEENVEVLPPQLAYAQQERQRLVKKLVELPAWRFRYHGTPQFAARELMRALENGKDLAA